MNRELTELFGLRPGLSYLNHASYGAPTRELLALAQELRVQVEGDTAHCLGRGLVSALHRVSDVIRAHLHLPGGQCASVPNATEANNALASSIALGAGRHIALFDSEYSSVIRCWQTHASNHGANVTILPMTLPATRDRILESIESLDGSVQVLICSAISSSAAIVMPLREISDICSRRGISLIIDAAHLLGHMDDLLDGVVADAVFGSLHKWLPTPRPAGFLWLRDGLESPVRPATVSLAWDAPDLVERFSWWGTWDPAASLVVPEGFSALDAWARLGRVSAAEDLAADLSDELESLGLAPSAEPGLRARRLRAFLVPHTAASDLKNQVYGDGVRAWVGEAGQGRCLLRVSTNVYNDAEDVSRLVTVMSHARAGSS